jgi:diguanylate cyclase (GGDEF)-like protein
MPYMTGIQLTQKIRAINRDVPIIVLTAFSDSEYLMEAINLGVNKYVLKPVNLQVLLNTMSQSLLYHELRYLYKDTLTGIPTRNSLIKDLHLAKGDVTVALIDIDKFSVLNDLYGESNGDQILLSFTKRLQYHFPTHYQIYRVGADKFIVLDKIKEQSIETLKDKCKVFSMDIDKNGVKITSYSIYLNITIGIAQSNDQNTYAYAQRVLQKARKSFKQMMVYDKELFKRKEDLKENLKWIKKLKNGATSGNFKPFFQPIVDTNSKKVYKYEALIRYVEEDGNEIPPYKFLPIAKKAKLFPLIVQIMLTSVLDVIRKKQVRVALNISYEDIFSKETNAFIFAQLEKNKEASKLLDFELLESEEIKDFKLVREFINKARSFGCKVGVDDFGAGYSNFNMLEALNIDFVKIDGSLIKNVDQFPKQALIVETISQFCTKLGIDTVAEFVSNEDIYLKVKSLGINYAQGWHFGQAVPCETLV